MKNNKNILYNVFNIIYTVILCCFFQSCEDFLDRAPLANITPEAFFNEESQLASYTINLYPLIIPAHYADYGIYGQDMHTDNMAYKNYDSRFVKGLKKVGDSGGDWDFTNIRHCNYFFENVMPKYEQGKIKGNSVNIKHYIGETYFLRAFAYFTKLKQLGDFPIITSLLPQNADSLTLASKRYPRNEVSRFIINDLDSAINLLSDKGIESKKNRITKSAAYMLKSRVALYEASWLKYHANTPFVPNGPNWPGKAIWPNYNFPSGSIEKEIEYFFHIAKESAKAVIDVYPKLTTNTQKLQQSVEEEPNPYFDMFSDEDMSKYPEIIMWRKYSFSLGVTNTVSGMANKGGAATGLTRGFIDNFLMINGMPIYNYHVGDYYKGDDSLQLVVENRDNRLFLFMKKPKDKNVLFYSSGSSGNYLVPIEPYPSLLINDVTNNYPTGYASRKGLNFDGSMSGLNIGYGGCIVFRATEAYLNYMEASYELNHNLEEIRPYWEKIRQRAGFAEGSIDITINNTNINKEAPNDWGAYSHGKLLSDVVLYNIRRERRCEFISEGMRYEDLRRWRSMDQLIDTPYHIEGIKLWGGYMDKWYVDSKGKSLLKYDQGSSSNISSPKRSLYVRPYEKTTISEVYDGYTWMEAYYLSPIAQKHFQLSGGDKSIIYQNPYWPIQAGESAIK